MQKGDRRMSVSLLDHALKCNRAGYSIIFTGPDKRATHGWKLDQERRASPNQLRERFKRQGDRATGIAVVHGPVSSDVYCRDFDILDSYERWAASYPDLAETLPQVRSFRGPHVYFRCAEELATKKCGDGEVRGVGGYTVWPPSPHPAGVTYSWNRPLGAVPSPDDIPYLDPVSAGFFQNWQSASLEEKKAPPSSFLNHCAPEHLCTCAPEHLCTYVPVHLCDTDLSCIVEANLPKEKGQNHSKLFALARQVKAFEKGLGRSRSQHEAAPSPHEHVLATDDLERVFSAWYSRSLPFLRAEQSRDEYLIEFLEAYQDARGDGLAEAWASALRNPPPACAKRFEDPNLKLLVSLLRELQKTTKGDNPFFLSCRSVESLLGINNRTAARTLKALCGLRIIQLVQLGTLGRASLYRYLGDREGEA